MPDRRAGPARRPASGPAALFVGLATLDLVLGVERIPGPDEKVVASSQLVAAGGPAANAAVACAWAGVPARLLTILGCDPVARLVAADLERHGVTVTDAAPEATSSPPVAAVLVTEGTGARAVVSRTDRDAPAATGPHAGDLAEVLAGVGVVVADGHHQGLAVPLLAAARAASIPTLLDAGSWRSAFEALVPLADLVVASGAFRPPGVDDAAAVPGDLLARGAHFAATTHGPDPIRWQSRTGAAGTIPVQAVAAVDTLGAGDVLHGVLAAQLARVRAAPPRDPAAPPLDSAAPPRDPGLPDDDRIVGMLRAAAGVASASCGSRGTRAWLDTSIARPSPG